MRRAEGSDNQKDATCKGWRRSSSAKQAAAAFAVSTASGASGMTKNRWLAGQDRQSAKGSTVADRVSSAPHDEQYDLALNSSGTIADRIAASSVSPISQPQTSEHGKSQRPGLRQHSSTHRTGTLRCPWVPLGPTVCDSSASGGSITRPQPSLPPAIAVMFSRSVQS